jgi:hypothetical protein
MKLLILFALILTLSISCDKSKNDVSPSDNLYKRWKSVEIGRDGKDWRDVTSPEIIEFRADGTVAYENRTLLCCSPTKIDRNQNVLKVIQTGDSNPTCASVDCVGVSELRILSLSDSDLVIDYRFESASMYTVYYVAAK